MRFLLNSLILISCLAGTLVCSLPREAQSIEHLNINIKKDSKYLPYSLKPTLQIPSNPVAKSVHRQVQVYKPQRDSSDSALYIRAYNPLPNIDQPSMFSFMNFRSGVIIDDDPIRMTISDYTICYDEIYKKNVVVTGGYVHDSAFIAKFVPASGKTEWLFLTTGIDRTGDGSWTPEIFHVGTYDYDHDGRLETFFYLNSGRDMAPRELFCIEVSGLRLEWSLPVAPIVRERFFHPCGDSLNPGVIFTSYNPKQGATDSIFSDLYGYITIVNQHGKVVYNKIIARKYGGMGVIPAESDSLFYVMYASPFVNPDTPDSAIKCEFGISKIDIHGNIIASAGSDEQLRDVWINNAPDSTVYIYTVASNGTVRRYDKHLQLLAQSQPSPITQHITEFRLLGEKKEISLYAIRGGLAMCTEGFYQLAFYPASPGNYEPIVYDANNKVLAFLAKGKNNTEVLAISRKSLADIIEIAFWNYQYYIIAGLFVLLIALILINYYRLRIQKKLHNTKQDLQAFKHASPDLLFRFNNNGRFLDYEGSDVIALYHKPEEFLGKLVTEVMPEEIAQQTLVCIKESLDTGEIRTCKYVLPVLNGTIRHFEARMVPTGPDEVVAVVRDITEQYQIEQTLATRLKYEAGLAACSQTLLASTVTSESLTEALHHLLQALEVCRVYIFENFDDPSDGLCMRQTHEACAPGISPEINNPVLQHLPYKDGFSRWRMELSQGHSVGGIVETFPQGERDILEPQDILSVLVLPIFVSGRWYGFIGFDDTKSKHPWDEEEKRLLQTAAEIIGSYLDILISNRKLKEERDFTRSILNTANSLIVCLDDRACITVFNKELERLTGYTSEEVMGKNWPELFMLEKDRHEGLKNFREWVLAHPEDRYEGELITKSGEIKTILWSNSSIVDSHTGQLTAIAIGYDITDRKQAEEALRQNEKKMRAQYKGMPVPTYTWQKREDDFVLIDYNDAAVEMTDGAIVDFIGNILSEMYSEIPEIADDIRQCYRQKTTINREMIYKFRTTNRVRLLSVRYVFIEPDLVMVHTEDITERRQALESLKESEARYQELFNSVMEGIGVVDKNEIVHFCNPAYAKIFDEDSVDDIIGRSLLEFLPEDQYELLLSQTELRKKNISSYYELKIITRKGQEKILLVSVSPRLDKNGQYTGAFGTVIDITDRKETEAKLRESEKRFRDMANLLPQIVFEADLNGMITFANRCGYESYGYTPKDVERGLYVADVYIPEDRERLIDNFQKRIKGEKAVYHEYTALRKDGSTFPVLIYSSPIIQDGKPVGLRGVVVDVTELKEAEKEIRRSELARYNQIKEIAGGISHEIYNSLYPAMVSLEKLRGFIEKASIDPNHYRKLLKMTENAVSRAVHMTELVTAYSRLDTQKKIEIVNLQNLVQEIIDNHSRRIEELDIKIILNIPPEIEIGCLKLHAHSLFNNLVTNALDALAEVDDRQLIISATLDERNTRIEVSDTGIGIPEKDLVRIFDAFFSTKPRTGTGLGLAMVKRIVDMYGGRISVSSELDRGTQFVILLTPVSARQT